MTWIVALTAGRWQRHSIKQAKSMGIKVFAVDADPNAEGFEDADISSLVTELQTLLVSQQAAQQTFVQIGRQTLFDFIR